MGIQMLPLCVIPPLCIGAMAAGLAMGTALEGASAERKYRATWLSPEDAAVVSAIFNEHATSTTLQKRILDTGPRAADRQGFPRLVVRLEAVELLMDGNGVASFVLRAQAQAFPAPNVEWKPTEHVVRFPSRRPNVWLASDGKFLLSTLNTALDTLSASIVSVYLPEKRMSSNQESNPLVEALGNNATDSSPGLKWES